VDVDTPLYAHQPSTGRGACIRSSPTDLWRGTVSANARRNAMARTLIGGVVASVLPALVALGVLSPTPPVAKKPTGG
jgi:hypothetical protein